MREKIANLSRILSMSLLAACSTEISNEGRSDTDLPEDALQAVILTVADDYTSAALATVTVDGRALSDTLAPVSTDPAVVVREGRVYQINRYGFDSIRVYIPGEWSAPTHDFSVGSGANPQQVEVCGGKLFVSLYGKDFLGVYGLNGEATASAVSLDQEADADGLPEAASMVLAENRLYVALNKLDQQNGWIPSGAGRVVAIDCATDTVVDGWDVGPNPSIVAYPGDASKIIVRTGIYYDSDYAPLFDGALSVLDLSSGTSTELVSETAISENITDVVATDDGALFLTENAESEYGVHCLDLANSEHRLIERTSSFLIDASVNELGEVWVAARPNWAHVEANVGTAIYDLKTCASLNAGGWLQTTLPPYAIAFY